MADVRTARVLVTLECNRNCAGCCNGYKRIMAQAQHITALETLRGFEEILITGGEPLLYPARVAHFAQWVKLYNPTVKLYLYTALYKSAAFISLARYLDGVTFTLHAGANGQDIDDFQHFQMLLDRPEFERLSKRLVVDNSLRRGVELWPFVWNYVKVKPWMTEDELIAKSADGSGIPAGEKLFVLEGFDD